MYYAPPFVSVALTTDYEETNYLVKNINKDVCTKLASFGNQNILRDIINFCNSQVANVLSDTVNGVDSILWFLYI